MRRLLTGIFLLFLTPLPMIVVTAQETEPVVYIRVRTPEGYVIPDACFTFLDASNEGCDDDADGYIRFEGIAPGDYVVTQTTAAEGFLRAGDFPVSIEASIHDRIIDVVLAPEPATPALAVNIAIRALDPGTRAFTSVGCLILHGGSIEGCDENNDGQITFDAVTPGSYLVEETSTPEGAIPLMPQWIVVDRSGEITVTRIATGQAPNAGTDDIAVLTRDPGTGSLIPGACYIVVDASIEGCDENGDGAVDFQGIPRGVYVLQQTVAPAGYDPVDDFWIDLTGLPPGHTVVVKQSTEQHDADHRHVTFTFYQTDDVGLTPGQVCMEIVGASIEGCDDNGDGSVDLLDVPVGTWAIEFTQLPAGYTPAYDAYEITVAPTYPFSQMDYPIGLTPIP